MPKSFKGFPRSVGEFKSEKSSRAKDWQPRELLISFLRRIDEGKITPTRMVVMYEDDENTMKFGYDISDIGDRGRTTWVGLIERVKHDLMGDD